MFTLLFGCIEQCTSFNYCLPELYHLPIIELPMVVPQMSTPTMELPMVVPQMITPIIELPTMEVPMEVPQMITPIIELPVVEESIDDFVIISCEEET